MKSIMMDILETFLENIGFVDLDLEDPTLVQDEGEYIEGVLHEVSVDSIIRKVVANPVLYRQALEIGVNKVTIALIEKINSVWTTIQIKFERGAEGTVYKQQLTRVTYFGEFGENFEVPSFAVYDRLKTVEIGEIATYNEWEG